jgi:sulfur-oxidizing protein SoxX
MRTPVALVATLASAVVLVGALGLAPTTTQAQEAAKPMSVVEEGKKIAFDRRKGNCLACHMAGDGQLPGNIGPPLIAMKARYPDKSKLREQIHDPRAKNPNSSMPPYGAHGILTPEELDKVVEYIYTL